MPKLPAQDLLSTRSYFDPRQIPRTRSQLLIYPFSQNPGAVLPKIQEKSELPRDSPVIMNNNSNRRWEKQSQDLAGFRLVVATPRPPIFILEFLTEPWGQGSFFYLLPNCLMMARNVQPGMHRGRCCRPKPLRVGERWSPRYYLALVARGGRSRGSLFALSLCQGFCTPLWHLLRESEAWEQSRGNFLESGVGKERI